jgi:hypothetical protein
MKYHYNNNHRRDQTFNLGQALFHAFLRISPQFGSGQRPLFLWAKNVSLLIEGMIPWLKPMR